jgi:cell division protein FtsA
MKERTIVGLDIGSSRICTTVGQALADGEIAWIASASAPARGVDRGRLVDIEEAAKAIAESVRAAERLSGYHIGTAFVSISGAHIQAQRNTGVVAVGRSNPAITLTDIDRVVESAQAVTLTPRSEIIHVIPRVYAVDQQRGIRDPLGMTGFRLEVEALLLSGDTAAITNLIRSIQRAGLDIDELVAAPVAACASALTGEEREHGVLLIDIGAGTTSVAAVTQGQIAHCAVLPIGGMHVTNDIAMVLQVPAREAERLKCRCGRAVADPATQTAAETVAEPNLPAVSLQVLNQIITARSEEIADMAARELRNSASRGQVMGGVALTGGGALLPGMADILRETLCLPVRIVEPAPYDILTTPATIPPSAVSMGLVQWGAQHGPSSHGHLLPDAKGMGLQTHYNRIKGWLQAFVA